MTNTTEPEVVDTTNTETAAENNDQQSNQIQKLTEQVHSLQAQLSQLQSELQFVQKTAQLEGNKQYNQIQGLSHILIDLVSQSREHEQNRQQFAAQRVHHLFTGEFNPIDRPPPPMGEFPPNNMGMNALQQGIQIQQQQQMAQGQLLQDQQQQHALRQAQLPLPQWNNGNIVAPPLQPVVVVPSTPSKTAPLENVSTPSTTGSASTTKGRRGPYKKRAVDADTTSASAETSGGALSPKRRKTSSSVTTTSVSTANSEDGTEETFQNVVFVKAPSSVSEIWDEYTVGTENSLSIKALEEQYKTSWRREPAVAKKFNRRKPIYMAIERGLAKGFTLERCLDLLEKHRKIESGRGSGTKQPIGWLGHGNLPEELKEPEKDAAAESEEKREKKEKERKEKLEKREQAKLEKEKLRAEKVEKAKAAKEAKLAGKNSKKSEDQEKNDAEKTEEENDEGEQENEDDDEGEEEEDEDDEQVAEAEATQSE
ncbi:hypothetical protein WICPIJ_000863 [Wickerhamomyces pijperi]|uniref:Transcription activator GCR1-like domain-containing protein n=1 Tax=Wickerhamomyces pijperi TaxID=599730 RepID=A0A9P8QF45_WICPI|nr:hypothetical protein WICPIJ_000863 [Wickerhamomyces pijperi]